MNESKLADLPVPLWILPQINSHRHGPTMICRRSVISQKMA